MLGKLLSMALFGESVGQAVSGLHLARKFAADLALILMLTIIASMLIGSLAVAGLYECYVMLMRHGLDADMSALVTAVLSLFILAIIGATVAHKIRRIRAFPFKSSGIDGKDFVRSALRGFLQGWMDKHSS